MVQNLTSHRLRPQTKQDVMRRYPYLVSHMICESLGYFTPGAAAMAVRHHMMGEANFCEWYVHMAQGYDEKKVIAVGVDTIRRAFQNRHHHHGYMAEVELAKRLVLRELVTGEGPLFASWF